MDVKIEQYSTLKYLDDMIMFSEQAILFTKTHGVVDDFLADIIMYPATLRCIQQTGWIGHNLHGDLFSILPQKDWMRILAAGYAAEKGPADWDMDGALIFSLAKKTIPKLLPLLKEIRANLAKTYILPGEEKLSEGLRGLWKRR